MSCVAIRYQLVREQSLNGNVSIGYQISSPLLLREKEIFSIYLSIYLFLMFESRDQNNAERCDTQSQCDCSSSLSWKLRHGKGTHCVDLNPSAVSPFESTRSQSALHNLNPAYLQQQQQQHHHHQQQQQQQQQ